LPRLTSARFAPRQFDDVRRIEREGTYPDVKYYRVRDTGDPYLAYSAELTFDVPK